MPRNTKIRRTSNSELELSSAAYIMKIERVHSGSPWESKVGYCRALRIGNQIFISGTAPIGEGGKTFAPGNPYAQTKRCFEIIEQAIHKLGANLSNIVRTRLFVTDISKWQEYGKAHGELFSKHPPATSMVEVKGLIDKDMMVEVEADAMVQ